MEASKNSFLNPHMVLFTCFHVYIKSKTMLKSYRLSSSVL